MSALRPGYCAIELPFREDLTQQHGYVHAGIVGAIVDSAGGYAGFTLFPADASVLTVEYKLNLLAPAAGLFVTSMEYTYDPYYAPAHRRFAVGRVSSL